MREGNEDQSGAKESRSSIYLCIGIVGTIVYIFIIVLFTWDRLPKLFNMDLNNMGDFFAGIFAPLAFMWLVLGFFQQGRELRLQIEELRKTVEHQGDLVRIEQGKFELEINREQETEKRLKESYQPKFVFNAPKYKFEKESSGRFDVVNAGNNITQVSVKSNNDLVTLLLLSKDTKGEFSRISDEIALWEMGGYLVMRWEIDDLEIEEWGFDILYTDSGGEEGKQKFVFKDEVREYEIKPV